MPRRDSHGGRTRWNGTDLAWPPAPEPATGHPLARSRWTPTATTQVPHACQASWTGARALKTPPQHGRASGRSWTTERSEEGGTGRACRLRPDSIQPVDTGPPNHTGPSHGIPGRLGLSSRSYVTFPPDGLPGRAWLRLVPGAPDRPSRRRVGDAAAVKLDRTRGRSSRACLPHKFVLELTVRVPAPPFLPRRSPSA